MMDYDAQEGYQTPDVDLEGFSSRSMFEFTKQHPYVWKNFRTSRIFSESDISGNAEERKRTLIKNSIKMYQEIDLPSKLNAFFAQQEREKVERAALKEKQRFDAEQKKAEDARKQAAIAAKKKQEAEVAEAAAAKVRAQLAAAAEKKRKEEIAIRKKLQQQQAAATRQRNKRIAASSAEAVLLEDILSYEKVASEYLEDIFKAIKVFKPVLMSILTDASDPDKVKTAQVYKQTLKGIRTMLKNLSKKPYTYAGGGTVLSRLDNSSSGYSRLLGLSDVIFRDLYNLMQSFYYKISQERYRSQDPFLSVRIDPPFDVVTDYNLNIESEFLDMQDVLLRAMGNV
jgi:hypothetical protein